MNAIAHSRRPLVALAVVLATTSLSAQSIEDLELAPTTTSAHQEELAGDSPAAAVRTFLAAAVSGQWAEAGRYLSVTNVDAARRQQLAQRLQSVLDSRRIVDFDKLSVTSAGRLDDGLPPHVEQIGVLPIDGHEQPIRLVRTTDAGGAFWAFSPLTMSRVDAWYGALPDRWIRNWLSDTRAQFLFSQGPLDLLWWQWLGLPILAAVAWAAGRLLRVVVAPMATLVTNRTSTAWDGALVSSLGAPLTLAFGLLLFAMGCAFMGLRDPVLRWVGSLLRGGLAFAFVWGVFRSIAVFASWTLTRPWARTNPSTLSLLTVGSNILRGAVLAVGTLGVLAAVGYPVGTVLAGLGIGGLALAFGAQKTVENVFGSMALAVDQPLRVGDFVKVEDFVGTVEDIGLRSTRFRTLDRTVVSIPNGKLADQRLESFQLRDRMRLAATIGLSYATTRDQLRVVLAGIEGVLRAHPRIWPDAVVVKFKELGPGSLDIEVMAWFDVPTWGEFQVCREEVLLDFMRVVEEAGTAFALPTRNVHLVRDTSATGGITATGVR